MKHLRRLPRGHERSGSWGLRRIRESMLWFGALLALGACSTSVLPEQHPGTAGWQCKATDECNSGLSCELLGEIGDSTACRTVMSFCTVTCNSNADCTSLGSGFRCQGTCGGKNICVGP
jgi:hypothetical protein